MNNNYNNDLRNLKCEITIIDQINDWFNLDVPISMDYIIVKNDSIEKNFMWIGRVYPYRWITIHEIPMLIGNKPLEYWDQFELQIINLHNYFYFRE